MPKHNILCTICKKVLKSTDDICSTNCGHVFHFGCMNESKSQSTCPECQQNNPTSQKINLFFDECKDTNLSKNWNDKMKIIELHKQIEENKSNYLHLQEKYVVSQDCVRRLEGRIKKSEHSLTQRSVILSDLEDRIKTLEELNEYLTIDNECKSETLTLKSNEIFRLKNDVAKLEKTNSCATVLNGQISKLEQNLKDHSLQLHKEAEKCSQLSKEKEKLQKYIDLTKLEKNQEVVVANETYSTKKRMTKETVTDLDALNSIEKVKENSITDSGSTLIRSPDTNIFHSFTGFIIKSGLPLNNYFSTLFIKNQQTKKETLQTANYQITTCTKLKLILRQLQNKCLIRSTILVFIFLMSNVTAVY